MFPNAAVTLFNAVADVHRRCEWRSLHPDLSSSIQAPCVMVYQKKKGDFNLFSLDSG
jgi:hypothetical protein